MLIIYIKSKRCLWAPSQRAYAPIPRNVRITATVWFYLHYTHCNALSWVFCFLRFISCFGPNFRVLSLRRSQQAQSSSRCSPSNVLNDCWLCWPLTVLALPTPHTWKSSIFVPVHVSFWPALLGRRTVYAALPPQMRQEN